MTSAVVGSLRVNLGLNSAEFMDGLRGVQGSLRNAGRQMQSAGRSMSMYLTAPIVGLGALTIKTAGDFEKSMNQVRAVSGATGEDFEALREQARQLGAVTQFSASQAADAMNFLAMAGMDTNSILGAMPDTLQLAAAAQLDMASAADIVTNVLAGYNMGVDELSHATDVLVKSFTSANTDLPQLAEAMKYAGPLASAAGVQFEEAAAAMAMMGNAGIQGSMAGTSLRGAISRILAPTEAMVGAMGAAGLSFTDASGKLLPLADIIEQLEPHADNAGLFMELFGQRAGPAMAALVSQGSDAVRELTGELENSGGIAAEIADVQMEGFNGSMRLLASAFEDLQLAIADSGLLEWITDAVTALATWVQEVSKTNPEMLKWGTIVAAAAAAAGPLLIGLGLMATAMAAISAPVLLAVAGLTALAGAITYAYVNWDEISQKFPAGAAIIESVISGIITTISLVADEVLLFGQYLGQLFTGDWEGAAETARAMFSRLGQAIMELVEIVFPGFAASIVEVKAQIVTYATEMLDAFLALPGEMMQIGREIISGLWSGISERWESVKGNIASIGSGIADSFRSVLGIQSPSRVMHDIGVDIVRGLDNGLKSQIGSVDGTTDTIATGIEGAFDGLTDSIAAAIDGTKKWKDVAIDAVLAVAQSMLSNLGNSGGFAGFLPKIFGIPGFAAGTNFAPGGLAIVGERGPELVDLPRGSRVTPNHELGGATRTSIEVSLSPDLEARVLNAAAGQSVTIVNAEIGSLKSGFGQSVHQAVTDPRMRRAR